jgi:hypothetical protein
MAFHSSKRSTKVYVPGQPCGGKCPEKGQKWRPRGEKVCQSRSAQMHLVAKSLPVFREHLMRDFGASHKRIFHQSGHRGLV